MATCGCHLSLLRCPCQLMSGMSSLREDHTSGAGAAPRLPQKPADALAGTQSPCRCVPSRLYRGCAHAYDPSSTLLDPELVRAEVIATLLNASPRLRRGPLQGGPWPVLAEGSRPAPHGDHGGPCREESQPPLPSRPCALPRGLAQVGPCPLSQTGERQPHPTVTPRALVTYWKLGGEEQRDHGEEGPKGGKIQVRPRPRQADEYDLPVPRTGCRIQTKIK